MSYKSQPSSHRGAGRQFSKSAHEKKVKEKKQRTGAKYLQEETPQATAQQTAEKTIGILTRLGNQIFALSPFSQYFDDWLVTLRQTVSEFESHPTINSDDQFRKQQLQIFQDIEGALAENRLKESTLTDEAKALADVNHKIADADKEYAEQTRKLSNKRNSEVQRLTTRVGELEEDVAVQEGLKFGFFQFKEKKLSQQKIAATQQELKTTKNQLETTLASFSAEQDKLHDNYEKHKQELSEVSDRLHRELEKLETDTSTEARKNACGQLAECVNSLLKRMLPAS
jgi:chromosome segregation ATPase